MEAEAEYSHRALADARVRRDTAGQRLADGPCVGLNERRVTRSLPKGQLRACKIPLAKPPCGDKMNALFLQESSGEAELTVGGNEQ